MVYSDLSGITFQKSTTSQPSKRVDKIHDTEQGAMRCLDDCICDIADGPRITAFTEWKYALHRH